MNLQNLKELNLTNGEIKVYEAVLELGITGLNKIQEKTGIERRNIYDILNKLIEKGLVSYTLEKGKRTYQLTSPNKLLEEIKKKEKSLEELKNQIPNLTEIFQTKKPEIRAEVYRGNESIKALLNESLDYKEQFWIGGNSGIEDTNLKIWFTHWMNERANKKIWMHDLADHGMYLEDLGPKDQKNHKKLYYKYQNLPKGFNSPMVIMMFGNKVAQILWSKQPFAFVLESKEIQESFMKYFNHFWKIPKKVYSSKKIAEMISFKK
jgi:HTH-type transcriptional regulator, sugar sensing transcriptional regulator